MWIQRVCSPLLLALIVLGGGVAMAEEPADETIRPYDGFQASADAQAYWDARRVDAINRQIGWNQLFRDQAAYASSGTIFYQPYVPGGFGYFGGYPDPYDWDATLYDWPYGRGRIFGYGYFNPVPQPIGQRQIQTGPNRWESHPVYAEDLAKPAAKAPLAVIPSPPPPAPTPAPTRGREF